jgi:hypothetical protein
MGADDGRFPDVGRADQGDLTGSGLRDVERISPGRALLTARLHGFARGGELLLQLGLHLLGGLVLWQLAPHFLQCGELLLGRPGRPILGVGLVVLRRQVEGHRSAPAPVYRNGAATARPAHTCPQKVAGMEMLVGG